MGDKIFVKNDDKQKIALPQSVLRETKSLREAAPFTNSRTVRSTMINVSCIGFGETPFTGCDIQVWTRTLPIQLTCLNPHFTVHQTPVTFSHSSLAREFQLCNGSSEWLSPSPSSFQPSWESICGKWHWDSLSIPPAGNSKRTIVQDHLMSSNATTCVVFVSIGKLET